MKYGALALSLAALGCQPRMVDVGWIDEGVMMCPQSTVEGIDVSHWDSPMNSPINWPMVKGAGKEFAFMKATEGTTYVDPTFATNWQQAGQAGIIRGAYHFFHPELDATAQADWFVQHAGVPAAGDLPLTIDAEVLDNVSGAQAAQAILTFLQRVEQKTGRTPIIYTSPSFFSSLGSPAALGSYTLWEAHWSVMCPNVPNPPWQDETFWQYSDMGTVSGIAGMNNVDLNKFNGTLADLQRFAGGNAPPPDAATAPDQASGAIDQGGGAIDLATRGDGGAADSSTGEGDLARPLGANASGCSCAVGAARAPDPLVLALAAFALLMVLRRRPAR